MGSFDDLIPGGSSQGGSGAFDDLIPKKSSLARRVLGDTGVSALKGAVGLTEVPVGIADILTGGNAGKALEGIGYRPKEAKAALDEYFSPEQKAANQYVQEGDGFLDTVKRGLSRPSVIAQSVVESLPLLLPGAAAARGIGAATKVAPYIAGAAGEGLVGAGSAAEQLRQGSEDGTISGKQTLGALASGVGTAGFGALGGKVASSAIGKRLGVSDIDTVLAGGASNPANSGIAKRALSGAVSEGVLEELPQSMWEQAAQNYATDKPLGEGVGQAGAMGLLAGTAMGGTFNAMQRGEQRKAVDDTKLVAEEATPAALGLTYQPGLIPGVDVGEQKQATIQASDMPVVDFQKSPVYGPTAPVSRADEMQGIDFTPEPKLQETGPMSSAVNVGVDSGATSLRPQGSFSNMSEFANLLGEEQQDVQSRRTGIAGRQALQREVALRDADQRVADQMAKEAAQRRRAVLDQVLSDPTTQNPADRFAAELQRQGFRDSTPTADELATVQRFNDIKAAEPASPEIEPSLPNELDAEQLGIRSRKGSSGAQSSGRDKVAEVRQLVADGWKISNKTLVSPTGKKRILNTAEHSAAKEATRERNLAAMERYRQSKGKGTPVAQSTTNVASEETNAPEIEQLAPQAPQANDAQVEPQPSSAPQAEGVEQPNPAEATPSVAQSDVEDYGKRVVRRNKPVSKWTAEEIQDRLARADSGESPISDESRSQLQAALEPLVAANKEKEAKAAEQAERVKKMQAAKAANKDTFQIGENKDSLERVSVRDGVVHLGDYPATDYNSGDDITVPGGATKQQVLDALIAGEAVTKKAKVWGKNGPEQSVADRIAELQAERDAMSKAAQKYADQVQSAISAGEQEGISKAEVMADIGAKNEEVGQVQRGSQEGANGNDGSPDAATEGGREERDGDAQGQEREVTADGRVSSESKQSKQDQISDFGEKLGGAKKDRIPSLEKTLSDEDIATLPLSKIWPASEIDGVENKFAAAVSYAARNEIPSKPRVSYKVASWVEKVKMLRGIASKIVGIGEDKARELFDKAIQSSDFKSKIRLMEAVDRSQWSRIGKVGEYPNAYRYGEGGEKIISPSVIVEIDGKTQRFEGAKSISDAMDRINAALSGDAEAKKMQFEVRGRAGAFSINKKGDKEYRKLKTFSTTKEAFDFIKSNYDDLVSAWDGVKGSDNVTKTDIRNRENRPRTGMDRRNGKDVTDKQFQDAFGFRGVEFGNWVQQGANAKERQGMLNQAFDAMHDLAEIVGIPPKAISLNGTLGLGFGSRGSGSASAHFEPGNLVINLTKTRGAGTLAHEWFHALDNYFARSRNNGNQKTMAEVGNSQDEYRRQNFVTYKPERLYVHKTQRSTPTSRADLERFRAANPNSGYFKEENWQADPNHPEGVRIEVESAFSDLVNALNESPMARRSRMIDKGPNGYWSRIIERGARSFENYVISKMMEGGYNNDYLANVREVQDFPRSKERYPYLLPEEVAPISEAFDALFSTIQTKETDKGVAMFSRTSDAFHGVRSFVRSVINGSGAFKFFDFAKVGTDEARKLRDSTGLFLSGYSHSIDENAVRHVMRKHGNMAKEVARGQIGINEDDLAMIPAIVANYDSVSRGANSPDGKPTIVYQKTLGNGVTYYVEEVRTGREKLMAKTMWKVGPAVPRTTSEDGVVHTSETSGSQPDSNVSANGNIRKSFGDSNASRGQGSGMAFRDLQAVVDRVSKGFNNLPKIHVLDSPKDLSDRRDNERTLKEQIEQAGAMDDVEGAHHNGEIYLFASGIASEERAEHVLATHEITHYGLRGTMGKGLDSALQNIWLYNKEVRAKAAVLRMQLGLTSNVSAVEEVLAEMKDSDLVKLKGWRKMVQAFRDWAHKAGFDRIAAKLDGMITKGMSDQEKADLFVANMVNAARDWVRNGKPARGYDPGTSMLGDANFSAKNDTINVDGVDRPTTNSNGRPIAQTREALRNFWRWFGDSKVVDADGKPLVVYHGTRRAFDAFSPSSPRGAIGNPKGVYFSADKSVAEEYAQDVDGALDDKSRVIAAYIKIENDADGKTIDSAYRGREYVVFKPENIKSATGNNGNFDASNPDIRFSRNKSASVDASITEIFDGLAGRGLKKVRAEERLAEHPQAESIRYVQDNILDILEELEGAGTIKINC